MVKIGAQPISEIFVGSMGIKESYVGTDLVYRRPGGYIYIDLVGFTNYIPFIHKESAGMFCADGSPFMGKPAQGG